MPKLTIEHLPKEHLLEALRLVIRTANHLRLKHGRQPWSGKLGQLPTLYRHLYQTNPDGFWGAYSAKKLIGISCSVVRGPQWYLADLFVEPRHQDKGLGRQLLDLAMENGGPKIDSRALCTFSYNETSIALYSSYGIMPTLPIMEMRCKIAGQQNIAPSGLIVEEDNSRKSVMRIDRLEKEIRGYSHLVDLEFFAQATDRKIYQFYHGKRWVGYSIISRNALVAPAGAISPEYLPQIVSDSYRICMMAGSDACMVWVGGPNAAVYRTAISLGFRLSELLMFMSTKPYSDPHRYCPADLSIY